MEGTTMSRFKRRLAIAASATAIVATAVAAASFATGLASPAAGRAAHSMNSAVLGDYAAPIVQPVDDEGIAHIDTPATIAKLSAAHINTYAYLIYASSLYGTADPEALTQSEWDDLPGFAAAADRAGITVLVYIVPPSESHAATDPTTSPAYAPFGWDYHAWAVNIAQLAATHRNIRGMVIDDFAGNTAERNSPYSFRFTPDYVAQMRSDAKAIAPWLDLSTIMYYPDSVGTSSILHAYRNDIDGIVFPYRNEGSGTPNTAVATHAESEGAVVGSAVKCHSGTGCLQIHYPASTHSTAGQYAGVSQQIHVVGAAGRRTLSLWINDDFTAGGTSSYHYIQALIDGQVVASEDVNGYVNGWHKISIDVTDALRGKSTATLTLRLDEEKGVSNFAVSAFVDDVSGTGVRIADPGFEATGLDDWTTVSNDPVFTVDRVQSLNYLYMTYAARLGLERNRDANYQTSAPYVQDVVGVALDLTLKHVADGSLIYDLPLTSADANSTAMYRAVANLYRNYQ
jgi:hypothetical protein